MRQKTITRNVYKFEELSENAKERALYEYGLFLSAENNWHEYEIEYWAEKLQKIGFLNADIRFSGFWSQGDGASFTADVDLDTIVNSLLCSDYNRSYLALCTMQDKSIIDIDIDVTRNSHHYSHEMTCGVNIDWNCWDKPIKFENWLISVVDSLEKDIESLRYDLCREIYKSLKEEYYYQVSKESYKETCDANEYEFYSDGSMA